MQKPHYLNTLKLDPKYQTHISLPSKKKTELLKREADGRVSYSVVLACLMQNVLKCAGNIRLKVYWDLHINTCNTTVFSDSASCNICKNCWFKLVWTLTCRIKVHFCLNCDTANVPHFWVCLCFYFFFYLLLLVLQVSYINRALIIISPYHTSEKCKQNF